MKINFSMTCFKLSSKSLSTVFVLICLNINGCSMIGGVIGAGLGSGKDEIFTEILYQDSMNKKMNGKCDVFLKTNNVISGYCTAEYVNIGKVENHNDFNRIIHVDKYEIQSNRIDSIIINYKKISKFNASLIGGGLGLLIDFIIINKAITDFNNRPGECSRGLC